MTPGVIPGQTDILDMVLSNASQEWRDAALMAIRRLATTGQSFQAADVARIAGEPTNPNAWGAVLARAHRDGIVRCVGYGPSTRTTVRGSAVKIWAGAS